VHARSERSRRASAEGVTTFQQREMPMSMLDMFLAGGAILLVVLIVLRKKR
jgi:hypothetical protein